MDNYRGASGVGSRSGREDGWRRGRKSAEATHRWIFEEEADLHNRDGTTLDIDIGIPFEALPIELATEGATFPPTPSWMLHGSSGTTESSSAMNPYFCLIYHTLSSRMMLISVSQTPSPFGKAGQRLQFRLPDRNSRMRTKKAVCGKGKRGTPFVDTCSQQLENGVAVRLVHFGLPDSEQALFSRGDSATPFKPRLSRSILAIGKTTPFGLEGCAESSDGQQSIKRSLCSSFGIVSSAPDAIPIYLLCRHQIHLAVDNTLKKT